MENDSKGILLYILKCIFGCLIVFLISWLINYNDITWCMISVILVITPDSDESIPLAITRIKANIIGGLASLLCFLINLPIAVSILSAIVITIAACYFFNLMSGSRAALAAVIIIMLHGEQYNQPDFWSITFQRLISVIAGCLIALIVTFLFHKGALRKSLVKIQENGE